MDRSNVSPFPQYFQHIFLTKGIKLHALLWNLVVRLVFSSVPQVWYVEVRIPRKFSEDPFDFDITRVDCIYCQSCKVVSFLKSVLEKEHICNCRVFFYDSVYLETVLNHPLLIQVPRSHGTPILCLICSAGHCWSRALPASVWPYSHSLIF